MIKVNGKFKISYNDTKKKKEKKGKRMCHQFEETIIAILYSKIGNP